MVDPNHNKINIQFILVMSDFVFGDCAIKKLNMKLTSMIVSL